MAGIAEILAGKAIAEAVKPLVDRFQLALQRRGYGSSDIFTILARSDRPDPSKISGLGQIWSLPAGVVQKDVEVVLQDDEFHAVCRELVAVCIIGPADSNLKKVRLRLARLFAVRLPSKGVAPHELEKYADKLFEQMLDVCKHTAEALIKSTKAPQEVLNWAYNVIVGDILYSIEAKLEAPQIDPAQYGNDWITGYLNAFTNRHKNIDVPDFTSRRHAPYKDLFVEPSLLQLAIRLPGYNAAANRVPEPAVVEFRKLSRSLDRCVLLGDPGAGKSTSSTVMALQSIEQGKVPFVVTLRHLRGPHFELAECLATLLGNRYQVPVSVLQIRRLLESGRALVVFDGLDEILHNTDRIEMTKTVEAIAQRYPFVSILVTCRRIGYQIARLDSEKFVEYVIQPLTHKQVERYAHSWFEIQYEQYGTSPVQLARDFSEGARSMPDLVENPLLLSFICVLYRGTRFIPRTRPDLYRRCVELLLEWDEIRRITESSQDVEMALISLSRIAHVDDGRGLTARQIKDDLVPFMAEFFTGATIEAERLVENLLGVCRGRAWLFTDQGLNDSFEDIFSFTHASFREYLAALYRVRHSGDAYELAEHVYPSLTTGSAQIYIQICIWLYDARVHIGASQVVQHLCRIVKEKNPVVDRPGLSIRAAATLADEERTRRAIAIRSIADAADCVGLSRAAAREIVDLALEQVKQGDTGSAVSLLDANYRHGPAAREALIKRTQDLEDVNDLLDLRAIWFCLHIGTLAAVDDIKADISWSFVSLLRRTVRTNTVLQENLARRSDVFEMIAIQSGAVPIDFYFGRPLEELYFQLFTRHSAPLRMGPESLADWILNCFSAADRRQNNVPAAVNLLRSVALCVSAAGHLPTDVPIPELHYFAGDDDDRLEVAFRRISGYSQDCRDGMALFVAGLVSFPQSATRILAASNNFSTLRLSPGCQSIINAWLGESASFWRPKEFE